MNGVVRMKRAWISLCGLPLLVAGAQAGDRVVGEQTQDWYPPIEPFKTGYLRVSDLHEIHYELCGNPRGIPVMILHGGPGGGSYPDLRRYHDPARYLLVLHDQRGSGRSRPYCELRDNNTPALVEDIERLRKHLQLDQVNVFGGSWGSTLALAYAETYPEKVKSLVLRGVFTATKDEIDHFYHGGAGKFFPEVYAKLQDLVPNPERLDYPKQLLTMLQNDDPAVRRRASLGWASYELKLAGLEKSAAELAAVFKRWDPYDFSLIENHYMAHGCFLEEGQLLRDAPRIASIPTVIVHGRYDVICTPAIAYYLHQALPKSRLVFVESAGHTAGSPRMRSALVNAVKSLE